MLFEILPENVKNGLNRIDGKNLCEIRLREGKPVVVCVSGKNFFLGENGIVFDDEKAIIISKEEIEKFIFRASENSIYAVNNQIQKGFITIAGGIRIGVCGSLVVENGQIITINNFSSVNIRIPHEIKNCSLPVIKFLLDEKGFKNTLIISPPGAGKTTFLRDIALQLSNLNLAYNLLILDERFEIASCVNGHNLLDVGRFSDVLSGAEKSFGFETGIRAFKPDIIFTDELAGDNDINSVLQASSCGIKLVASVHAKDITQLKKKENFKNLLDENIFERYIVLSNENGPGTIDGVFDEKFSCLFCRWKMIIFALLIIVGASAFIGWQIKAYYMARNKFFNDIVFFCEMILNETNFNKTPIKHILKKNEKAFHKEFLKSLEAFSKSLDEGREYSDKTLILTDTEKELFENFLNGLGKTNLENHNNLVSAYRQSVMNKIEKEMDCEKKKGSAFFKISICIGICIAILCV